MPFDPHQRAQLLLDQSPVEGIPAEDQRWLDSHLEGCAACSRYAGLSRRVIGALDGFAFEVNPEAALRIQNAVRGRLEELASGERRQEHSLAVPVALVLTGLGSIFMWHSVAWLAVQWNLPARPWQIGFVVFWLLPSVLLDVLLLFPGKFIGAGSGSQGELL